MKADTRKLKALLTVLRSAGVSEYSDGTLTVRFGTPQEAPVRRQPKQEPLLDPTKKDPAQAYLANLRGGLFSASGEVG